MCAAASNSSPPATAGRQDDPQFKILRLLRHGHENLTYTAWHRLRPGLQGGYFDSQWADAGVAWFSVNVPTLSRFGLLTTEAMKG